MSSKRLMIPGPTPVPPAVARAMSTEMFNHRGPRFAELIADVTASLKRIFQTEGRLYILTSSGTGAMEAAVVNFLSPGDRIVSLVNGAFGDRFASIAAAYGGKVERLESPWGEPLDYGALEARLREDKDLSIRAITVVHNESSTGMLNDLEAISRIRGNHPAMLLVDTVSSMGAVDVPVDRLGLDVCFTASQKALFLPPGLSFISVGERAWRAAAESRMPRYYFDLRLAEALLQKGQTPFTPALAQFVALREALQLYFAEGRENCYARHRRMAAAVRAAARAMGLELLVKEERYASPTVTAIMTPSQAPGNQIQAMMRERFGIEIAGGQGSLEGKTFRVGHLGAVDELDILAAVGALEACLQSLGLPVERGAALRAAQEALHQ
ncbi:MAG: alanine--glyoxylate aminotransferase family protein [Firmicutes bacterium]|jgi:aspartate aminotransferase-like enzyme|nr:alanine--glyoxylate aminotransferase family protein [Bacillota bacterium]HPU02176.1 alanine--glyoxylate aminotransferase family protein [Bacillota bacterium]